MGDNDIYDRIAARYGFMLPPEYRAMEKAGYFDVRSDDTYLWVPETEWMSPPDILAYIPSDYHQPGFVPFAFNGAGDHWCWWPEVDPAAVVLCPHDCEEGEFDSSSFLGAAYRRMLEYAAYEWDAGDTWANEVRYYLTDWADRLSPFFPQEWCMALRQIAEAPHDLSQPLLAESEYNRLLHEHLAFPRRGEVFLWMRG